MDVEGRFIFVDVFVYVSKLKVDKIVDFVILIGVCIIVLGNDIGGMFIFFDEFVEEFIIVFKCGGEKLWRMFMEDSYWEMMKFNIVDMVNIGGCVGGFIIVLLFLKYFVDENILWVYLDIVGLVWKDKMGGIGFVVVILVEWVVKYKLV